MRYPIARRAAIEALSATRRTHETLLRRLAGWMHKSDDRLWDDVLMTDSGRAHLPGILAAVTAAIREVDAHG